jgi:hypothetical protein
MVAFLCFYLFYFERALKNIFSSRARSTSVHGIIDAPHYKYVAVQKMAYLL